MKRSKFITGAMVLSAVSLADPAFAASVQSLPLDQPQTIDNIRLACTGVGSREQHNPDWKKYAVKLETVGGYGQYLADENISLRGKNSTVLIRAACDAPWLVMQLDPGRYSATVEVAGAASKHVSFTAPARGQRDVIVRFPSKMAGREINRSQSHV